jgi:hypothetical protein
MVQPKALRWLDFKANLLIYNYLIFLNGEYWNPSVLKHQRLNLVARKSETLTPIQNSDDLEK